MAARQMWMWWSLASAAFLLLLAMGLFMTSRAAEHPQLAQVRAWFLPGATSHAHYQIELACESCHVKPFGGPALRQQACEGCHAAQLKEAGDKHPLSKFTDPRNAPLLQGIDATRCETCHTEHRPEITQPMGLTQPADFCRHCHRDVATDRPSHAGMKFDTCSSAGCHRYHDNEATYEDFLLRHAGQPATLARFETRSTNLAEIAGFLPDYPSERFPLRILADTDADAPAARDQPAAITAAWAHSAHARNGVNCTACHVGSGEADKWSDAVPDSRCAGCHALQKEEFQQGKHGMRLSVGLPPMQPSMARLPMHQEAAHRNLGCNSCHAPHAADRIAAARDACVGCHADEHTRAFDASPHGRQWSEVAQGKRPAAEAVSCASCHMPVVAHRISELDVVVNHVQHNQNATLTPSTKMLRPVCQRCHGLEFATDALADAALVRRNFSGRPAVHVASTAMAVHRDEETRRQRQEPAAADQEETP